MARKKTDTEETKDQVQETKKPAKTNILRSCFM